MTTIIVLKGKAKEVFPAIKLLAGKAGQLTLAELARLNKVKEG